MSTNNSADCTANSRALMTSYIDKLRLELKSISDTDPNINLTQFRSAFRNVFNGVSDETVDQLYCGFTSSVPSRYTAYNNTINYESLLVDDRLPQIMMILHNYSIVQIREFHRDAAERILGDDSDDEMECNCNNGEYDADKRSLINTLTQKLRYYFGELAESNTINLNEFTKGFESVFIGITSDIYKQIFSGFDATNCGEIDYYLLLKDDKLPKILLLLHKNGISQLSSLQESLTINTVNNGEESLEEEDINNKSKLLEEISDLKKENELLNDKYMEWRGKYEIEIKQSAVFRDELECDLEEEFKSKLNVRINEYESLLNEERLKYALIIDEYEVMLKQKEDEICAIKCEIKNINDNLNNKNGVFGVIKSLFNSTETESNKCNTSIGVITLNTLHRFDAMNDERKLISIYGEIFDVSHKANKYGMNGIYCHLTGHDITLCVIFDKWSTKWCDKFVQLNYKQIESVKQYIQKFKKEFVTVGKLQNYQEIQSNWPKLNDKQLNELQHDDDCIIM